MSNRGNVGAYGTASNYGSSDSARVPTVNLGRDGDFNRLSQPIGSNIQKVAQNVSQMQRLINQIGTQQDTQQLRDRLGDLQHTTHQLAKETKDLLSELSKLPPPSMQTDQKQQKLVRERLMNDFTTALNSFQSAQRTEQQKAKESVIRTKTAPPPSKHHDPFADDDTWGENIPGSGGQATMQAQAHSDVDHELLREREQALRQLESDITDVNSIFKDLAVMVHDQGEVVDSIEANVDNAEVNVEAGTQQLAKAREYQSKARKKKCICITVLVVVIAVIIIIIMAVYIPKN